MLIPSIIAEVGTDICMVTAMVYLIEVHLLACVAIHRYEYVLSMVHPSQPQRIQSGILLVRNPLDAYISEWNRQHSAGHVGQANRALFGEGLCMGNVCIS